jgi:hypothetical protein
VSIHDIAILGAVLVVIGLILALDRYVEKYDRKKRQGSEPEPPVRAKH